MDLLKTGICTILKDSGIIEKTAEIIMDHHVDYEMLHQRRTLAKVFNLGRKTEPRIQTKDLNIFPFVDRSLINYDKYHKYVGDAGMKCHMSIQATRGCPYKCFYCDIYKAPCS